ncbi:MAG: hypothetical protein N2691_04520 [Patescibacteria group bacterium]|nr:hypothetical protein [Patescibacteria group bacterium]
MNSALFLLSQPHDRNTLDELCRLLSQRDYPSAEKKLIEFLESLLEREYNISDDIEAAMADLDIIYTRFDQYYANWGKNHGISPARELEELADSSHENILLAHCSDPESMDDLVYEVRKFLAGQNIELSGDEAYIHLEAYKRNM